MSTKEEAAWILAAFVFHEKHLFCWQPVRKERPRIAQVHPLTKTQELPSPEGKWGKSGKRTELKNLPNTIKMT